MLTSPYKWEITRSFKKVGELKLLFVLTFVSLKALCSKEVKYQLWNVNKKHLHPEEICRFKGFSTLIFWYLSHCDEFTSLSHILTEFTFYVNYQRVVICCRVDYNVVRFLYWVTQHSNLFFDSLCFLFRYIQTINILAWI